MSLDSSANLLFNIGANSDDAEANIERFRALMGKNLEGLAGEFGTWAEGVLGSLATVQGAMIATGAVAGAAVVAFGGFALEAAHKYSEFVDEVARGSRTTGISAENMSKLKFAADVTHTSYEALTMGLTRFATTVVKAAQGSQQQLAAFEAIGISQEQVKAGETDLNGLLMVVADRFHELGSRVLQTAEARELFSRGGPALVKMLSQGSEGLREMGAEAEALGLVIGAKDVQANEVYKASLHMLKAEMEAFVIMIGRDVLPQLTKGIALVVGMGQAFKDSLAQPAGSMGFWVDAASTFARGTANAVAFKLKMEDLAKSLAKFGEENRPLIEQQKEGNQEWSGLVDLLEKIKGKSLDLTAVDARQAQELHQLQLEIAKTTEKFEALSKAGKLDPEDLKRQTAALGEMDAAVMGLLAHFDEEVLQKNLDFGHQLSALIAEQGERDYAWKLDNWAREYNKLVEDGQRKAALTKKNLELLAQLSAAGQAKIEREQAAAVEKAGADLESRVAAQSEKTFAEKASAWDREIAALANTLQKEGVLTDENGARLYQLYVAGHTKLDAEQQRAFAEELAKLNTHLGTVLAKHTTHEQELAAQYQRDAAAYSDAELAKAKALAQDDTQRLALEQIFAAARKGLLDKYALDLQTLQNSQGWQGVFGSKFGTLLKGNEALLREWAGSSNQSLMMVRVSLQGLRDEGQRAFEGLAQGMGQNIANAFIYRKSIGEAMRAAVASTLESLAAESLTWAIYSTALGFTRLAQHDGPGAASAFTAAAIWGSVGAAAAVAGRVVAPPQSATAAAAGAAGSTAAGTTTSAATGAGTAAPHVVVNVMGHVFGISGVEQLAAAINDAVLNRDVQLTATNTTTGLVVIR